MNKSQVKHRLFVARYSTTTFGGGQIFDFGGVRYGIMLVNLERDFTQRSRSEEIYDDTRVIAACTVFDPGADAYDIVIGLLPTRFINDKIIAKAQKGEYIPSLSEFAKCSGFGSVVPLSKIDSAKASSSPVDVPGAAGQQN